MPETHKEKNRNTMKPRQTPETHKETNQKYTETKAVRHQKQIMKQTRNTLKPRQLNTRII